MTGKAQATVLFHAPPDLNESGIYQRYYQTSLETVAPLRWTGGPRSAALARTASVKIDIAAANARARRVVRRASGRGAAPDNGHVGEYELRSGHRALRFVIDARDNHMIDDEDALARADVYFKANRWRSAQYPPNVVPIVNGNGFVTPRRIRELRLLRATPKEVDVVFVSNVWGGREHNVRIFEELSRFGSCADLTAVLPDGAVPADDDAVAARLRAAGVPVTASPVLLGDLWRRLARARIVVLRSGRHLCIPWRMIDLLAMGSCILFDAEPLPQWPEPLVGGVHYASMGIERPAWEAPRGDEYAKVAPSVERLLADEEQRHALASAAAAYFDRHAAPEAVGRYVLDTVCAGVPAILAPR
jgi:hypothetical protein